jgi:putative nucleotidyltransferase with HDIG domain
VTLPLKKSNMIANSVSTSDTIDVDLRQVIFALSDALDLVGIDDVGHGKRVGIMAAACAQALGKSRAETTFLFDLGMLHDIGVSSTTTHNNLVTQFDWGGSQVHCEVGYQLLKDFTPLARLADPVHFHHTRWDKLSAMREVSAAVAEQANLIYLVDRVDALAAAHYADGSLLMNTAVIQQKISDNAGTYFSPLLVESFLAVSAPEAFWLQLEPRGIQALLQDMQLRGEPVRASIFELKQLARIFSRIVDAKSPFTAEHSLGVAQLSRLLAERLNVSPLNCEKIEIAGLLHDLGKLRVPDEVLDKPGKLDERERKIINTHSYETYQILRHIKGFEDIAQWAAHHHEEPDGKGYPFHLAGDALPLEARILRVADIFQAMAQNRPYRAGLTAEAVLDFLNEMVAKGRLEAALVNAAASDMQASMAAALPLSH